MKWSSLSVVGLITVAKGCVVGNLNPTCPTKTISNVVANFDDRDNGIKLTHYHHLNFNNLTVEHQGTGSHHRGVIPHSKPHYGVGYDGQGPLLSIDGTKTTSFGLTSAWVGCIAASNNKSGYKAVPCRFAVDCVSTLSMEGHFGPEIYNFVPSQPDGAQMMFVKPNFAHCQQSPFQIWDAPESAVLVVDDIIYTINEGECLPLFQGGTNPSC